MYDHQNYYSDCCYDTDFVYFFSYIPFREIWNPLVSYVSYSSSIFVAYRLDDSYHLYVFSPCAFYSPYRYPMTNRDVYLFLCFDAVQSKWTVVGQHPVYCWYYFFSDGILRTLHYLEKKQLYWIFVLLKIGKFTNNFSILIIFFFCYRNE